MGGLRWHRLDSLTGLLPACLWAYSLSAVSVVVFREYLSIPLLASITFRVDDGWCSAPTESIGLHCFGDFQDIYSRDVLSPWNWVAPFSHPPLSQGIQFLFGSAGTLTGNRLLAVMVWLAVGLLALLAPALWAMRPATPLARAAIALILGLGSMTVIATLDRGNSVFLVSLSFFGLAWAASKGNWRLAVALSLAATLLRPQAIALTLVFLGLGQLKPFAISFGTGVVGLVASFWLYPGDHAANFGQWLDNLSQSREYASIFAHEVVNLSLLRSGVLLAEMLGVNAGLMTVEGTSSAAPFFALPHIGPFLESGKLTTAYSVACAILVLATTGLLYVRRRRLTYLGTLTLPAILVIVIPQTSFVYYSSLLLTPFAFAVRGVACGVAPAGLFRHARPLIRRLMNLQFLLLAVLALVPVALPLSLLVWSPSFATSNLSVHLVGPAAGALLGVALLALAVPERWFSGIEQPVAISPSLGSAAMEVAGKA